VAPIWRYHQQAVWVCLSAQSSNLEKQSQHFTFAAKIYLHSYKKELFLNASQGHPIEEDE
jgi:hypothetical protein